MAESIKERLERNFNEFLTREKFHHYELDPGPEKDMLKVRVYDRDSEAFSCDVEIKPISEWMLQVTISDGNGEYTAIVEYSMESVFFMAEGFIWFNNRRYKQ